MSELSISPNFHSLSTNGHKIESHFIDLCSSRKNCFKSNDIKDVKELRRRRSETNVKLRKQKKEDNFDKMRHIFDDFSFDTSEATNQEIESTIEEILLVLKSVNLKSCEHLVKCIRDAKRLIANELEINVMSALTTINRFLENDVLLLFNKCLESENISLVIEVLSLIVQLTSVETERENTTFLLVDSGIISKLIRFVSHEHLSSSNPIILIIEKSLMALSNIASASTHFKDIVLNAHFLEHLQPLLSSEMSVNPSRSVTRNDPDRIRLIRAISWTLFALCQHKDCNSYKTAEHLMVYLIELLQYPDIEVNSIVLRTLSITTELNMNCPQIQISYISQVLQLIASNEKLLTHIIEHLSSKNNDTVFYAIRIIGNLVTCDESFAQIVVHSKALNKFKDLITHQSAQIQKEVVFTLSNITSGNTALIQAVIDMNIIPLIVELLYFGDYNTQLEATYVIRNITAIGTIEQISYIININDTIANMNVFDAMATMLTCTDPNTIKIALQVYNNLLAFARKSNVLSISIKKCESCAAVYHIDSLQNTNNSCNSELASFLMEQYFSRDQSLEEEMFQNTAFDDEQQMESNFSF